MNVSYLLSVLNLYLEKEKDLCLTVNILNISDIVKVDFSYNNSQNRTYVKLNKKIFFENINLFINTVQKEMDVIEEDYNNNIYNITFSNNQKLSFKNFSYEELKIIRNNIKTKNEFVFEKVENSQISYNEIYKENSKYKLSFQMGFTGFMTIFLSAIWFLDIFMIALWIFKTLK